MELAAELVEFLGDAVVHHNEESGVTGEGCGGFVNDTLLHPDCASTDLDGCFDDIGNEFGPTKNIHNVDFFRDVFETGVTFFTED
jgi:hypothetical protein